jgi:2,3-diketo-5-methylthio-1-phosphopentane phosphatase
LAVRLPEATSNEDLGELTAKLAAGALRPGTHTVGPFALQVVMQVGGDVAEVAISVRNVSERPRRLLTAIASFAWLGNRFDSYRFLQHGWQSGSPTEARCLDSASEVGARAESEQRAARHVVASSFPDRNGWMESELVTVAGSASSGPVCLVGVYERGCSFGIVYLRRDAEGIQIDVELCVDAVLAPGEVRELEVVRIALGENASPLLEQYAEAYGRSVGARTSHPFISGWSSWHHFFRDVTESDILRNLEALDTARGDFPVEVVEIGDGYQRATGDWLETDAKFPRGLGPLAADIRAAGFTAGLWLAPFCAVSESRVFDEHAGWMLENGGSPFCGFQHAAWSGKKDVYVLDTSQLEVIRYLDRLFGELVALGFHYFNLDYLFAGGLACDGADPSLGRAQRLRRGLEAMRSGVGEEAFLLGNRCPLGAAVGVVDGMRISPEVAPSETASAVCSTLLRSWAHRRLWRNEPGCLLVSEVSAERDHSDREALAAAIAATGGGVFASGDIPRFSVDEVRLFRDTTHAARAIDQLGIPGLARLSHPLSLEAVGEVSADGPDATYTALFNSTGSTQTHSLGGSGFSPTHRVDRILGAEPEAADGGSLANISLAPYTSTLIRITRKFSLAVFCDFDGTFSIQDVGSTLAMRHAEPRRSVAWKRYERGEIGAWDFNLAILDGLEISRPEVDAFLQTVDLDPGAIDLVDWCRAQGVPFRILSDGFDYNLNRLQEIHGVRFAFDANQLRFDAGVWHIHASARNGDCDCGTGNCKRQRIEALRKRVPEATLVHIGNGRVSDTCGALAADVVFAKDSLAVELTKRGVGYESYNTLHDVIAHLEKLL